MTVKTHGLTSQGNPLYLSRYCVQLCGFSQYPKLHYTRGDRLDESQLSLVASKHFHDLASYRGELAPSDVGFPCCRHVRGCARRPDWPQTIAGFYELKHRGPPALSSSCFRWFSWAMGAPKASELPPPLPSRAAGFVCGW